MRKWFSGFGVALTLTAVLSISFAFASSELFWGRYDRIPEPNPPTIERDVPEAPSSATVLRWMAPSALTEWTYHKTGDNLHPDGNEQQMVWLMNRARSDPAQEGVWLATDDRPGHRSRAELLGCRHSPFCKTSSRPFLPNRRQPSMSGFTTPPRPTRTI